MNDNKRMENKNEHTKYYSITEFSKLAGCSRGTVYKLLDTDLKDYLKPNVHKKMISEDALGMFGASKEDNYIKLNLELVARQSKIDKLEKDNLELNNSLNEKNKIIDELHNKINELIENKNNLVNEKDRLEGQKAIAVSQLAEERSKVNYLENRGLWARIINRKSQKLLPEDEN